MVVSQTCYLLFRLSWERISILYVGSIPSVLRVWIKVLSEVNIWVRGPLSPSKLKFGWRTPLQETGSPSLQLEISFGCYEQWCSRWGGRIRKSSDSLPKNANKIQFYLKFTLYHQKVYFSKNFSIVFISKIIHSKTLKIPTDAK